MIKTYFANAPVIMVTILRDCLEIFILSLFLPFRGGDFLHPTKIKNSMQKKLKNEFNVFYGPFLKWHHTMRENRYQSHASFFNLEFQLNIITVG